MPEGRNLFLVETIEIVRGLVVSMLIGIAGGGICGPVILFFNAFIGRSETTGAEYFGYWQPWTLVIGLMYGAPIGAIVTPLAYPFLLRRIGFQKSLLPAFVGTLAGGFVGGVVGPFFAVFGGVFGFFVALLLARLKLGAIATTNPTKVD